MHCQFNYFFITASKGNIPPLFIFPLVRGYPNTHCSVVPGGDLDLEELHP